MKQVDREYFEELCVALEGIKIMGKYTFYRQFKFDCFLFGKKTKAVFIWYPNLCTLWFGETNIMFTHASINGYWPNRAETNLNVGYDENNKSAVIHI
jgi:hypothetical protein